MELNYKENEKVKISPIGNVKGLDGREYQIDANTVIKNTKEKALDLPLDENHSFSRALGWIDVNSLECREDGIYGTLSLNNAGLELIDSKAYRYLSPVFNMAVGRNVDSIDSIGFVNRPNLLNNALNHKESNMNEEEIKNELETLKNEIERLKATLKNDEGEKQANNASKDFAKEFENINNKLKEFEDLLKVFAPKGKFIEKNAQHLSESELKICADLGISEEDYLKTKESK